MKQYLSLADYVLLAGQILLALALAARALRARLFTAAVWSGWAAMRMAWFWYLALTVSPERYGDLFILSELADMLLLAVCAVDLGAQMLPSEYRGKVWRYGPAAIAAAVLCGYLLLEDRGRIVLQAYTAVTDIALGTALAVTGGCLAMADSAGEWYRTGRAFCWYLAGQLLAAQVPGWLGCDSPACLKRDTMIAHVARRAGPVLWAVAVAAMGLACGSPGSPERRGNRGSRSGEDVPGPRLLRRG